MARHRAPRKSRRLRSLITAFALTATGLVVASGPASAASLLGGRAYVLSAHGLLNVSPVEDTGVVAQAGDSFTGGCALPIKLGTLLAADGLCANVSTGVPPAVLAPSASATASAANVSVGVSPVPSLPALNTVISLRSVTAASVSACNGSQTVQKGDTVVGFLQVGTRVLIPHLIHPAKNQTIKLLGITIVLNQQSTVAGVLTVNAVHITIPNVQDIVVASASSAAYCSPA